MSSYKLPNTEKQASIFGWYLLKQQVSKNIINFFIKVGGIDTVNINHNDRKILAFVFNHPGSIVYIDSYFALIRPTSDLRRRLHLMFSVIEASPNYTTYFLNQQRTILYVFLILFVGTRAIFRFLVGAIIVKVWGL